MDDDDESEVDMYDILDEVDDEVEVFVLEVIDVYDNEIAEVPDTIIVDDDDEEHLKVEVLHLIALVEIDECEKLVVYLEAVSGILDDDDDEVWKLYNTHIETKVEQLGLVTLQYIDEVDDDDSIVVLVIDIIDVNEYLYCVIQLLVDII